jgi:ribosomal protein S18 acetylase RimI-like enzyme
VEIVAEAYVQPGHDLSYEHVTFAERGKARVGIVSGYTAAQHRGSSAEALKRAVDGHALLKMGAAFLHAFLRRFGPGADDEFYVWALAVDEELRGQGIGSVLMDFAEEHARASGSTRLTLDVEAKNDKARRFYERRGMTVESEWPTLPLVPPVTFRMGKEL